MITLASIKSDLGSIALRVAAFEAQQKTYTVSTKVGEIELNCDEEYVGLIISADGTKNHHIILLPGDSDKKRWKEQMAWAESIGGELPDRCESALLFAAMKDRFKPEWYWTREQHASDSDDAWGQYFGGGGQDGYDKSYEGRARAVRRLEIQ